MNFSSLILALIVTRGYKFWQPFGSAQTFFRARDIDPLTSIEVSLWYLRCQARKNEENETPKSNCHGKKTNAFCYFLPTKPLLLIVCINIFALSEYKFTLGKIDMILYLGFYIRCICHDLLISRTSISFLHIDLSLSHFFMWITAW